MAIAQRLDFVFQFKEPVHSNRWGCQVSRILEGFVLTSSCEGWVTHSIRLFPLSCHILAHRYVITFRMSSTTSMLRSAERSSEHAALGLTQTQILWTMTKPIYTNAATRASARAQVVWTHVRASGDDISVSHWRRGQSWAAERIQASERHCLLLQWNSFYTTEWGGLVFGKYRVLITIGTPATLPDLSRLSWCLPVNVAIEPLLPPRPVLSQCCSIHYSPLI
jgi:hypothetical protein